MSITPNFRRVFRFLVLRLALPSLLLAATVSVAAISFVQQNFAVPTTPQTSVSVTYTGTQAAGDTNVIAIGWTDSTSTITSVADTKGNVYSVAIGPTRLSGVQSQLIYVAKNVAAAVAGSNTVTVNFSAAVPWPDVRILEYQGLDTVSPVEAVVGAAGSGTTSSSGPLTTTNANDLLFAAAYVTSNTKAAGAGFTSRIITPDGDIAEDQVVTAAGSYSGTAAMNSGGWVMQLVALKAAGAPAATATPTFNPAPGAYTTAQTIHLQDATAGATIYYTSNGSTPTTSSTVYNDASPIQVTATTTIKAMAAASGLANSAVATGIYSIGSASQPISFVQQNFAVPTTPQSSVSAAFTAAEAAGDTNVVAIGWTDSTSTITSVTDTKGNVYSLAIGPTRLSGVQSQSIYVAKNVVAAAAGSNAVTVGFSAAVPWPDVRILEYRGLDSGSPVEAVVGAAGTGTTSNSGALTTSNANDLLFAAAYVTSSTKAAGAGFTSRVITPDGDIAQDQIVAAAGTYSGTAAMNSGGWVMQLVALKAAGGGVAAAATPTFNPAPGTYATAQTVHLLDATAGATIFYTTNGSAPTTSSTVYNDATPIQVAATTTINAMAAGSGLVNSAVASGTYTIQQGTTATPSFNPAPGVYGSAQTVHLLDATSGAKIYFTLDGSTPTTSSTLYNDATPIVVSGTTTIKAIAAATGLANSSVATGTYSIGSSVPIQFVQLNYVTPSTPQSSVSAAYLGAQTAGDTNVVAIGWTDGTSSVTSVTDTKGNTYSVAVGPTVQSGIQSQIIYVAKNIVGAAAGANSVTVKFNAAARFPDVRILEYRGLDPVSPIDATAAAVGSGTTSSSGPLSTSNAYDLIFAANYVTSTTNNSGNGFSLRVITNPDGDLVEDRTVTATGTYTATASIANGNWVMQAVALRGASSAPPGADPSVVGQWSSVTSWPILPIHVTLMPTGKVLAFGHDATNNTTSGTIWDPNTNTFQTTSFSGADLFCSGHGLLPDGRVFISGGHNMADYMGLKNATIFNPSTLAWSSAPAMGFARWYPTVTSLPDGRSLITSGAINCDGCNATIPEIYDPKANSWTQMTSAALSLPIYPHMFVLPDGRVLNTGSYELPLPTRALNISTQTWTTIDPTVLDAGSAVMYQPGKFLKTGTSATSDPPYKNAAATAYVLDMTQGAPAWQAINPMALARAYHNLTVLPDGNVLVTGGLGSTNPDAQTLSAYAAEMWSPATQNFTTMAAMVTPRVYHSTALLLPDGRVLVGGGGEYQGTSPDQLNAEIYSPPYLFKGSRPTVTSAPAALAYNTQFTVQTPDAANISSVALVRLGSVTHAFNENQRFIPLSFTQSVGSLTVTAPTNGNIAPPGHYMLFLVKNTGVPSVGVIVQFPAP